MCFSSWRLQKPSLNKISDLIVITDNFLSEVNLFFFNSLFFSAQIRFLATPTKFKNQGLIVNKLKFTKG